MNSLGEKVICFDGNNKEFYVSGLFGIVFLTGNELGFRIVKRKSYVDLKSGDKINNFKVIEGDFVKRNGRYIKC